MPQLIAEYQQLLSGGPVDLEEFLSSRGQSSGPEFIEFLAWHLKRNWTAGKASGAKSYVEQFPQALASDDALVRLAIAEYEARILAGENLPVENFLNQFPSIADRLGQAISKLTNTSLANLTTMHSMLEAMRSQKLFCERYRLDRLLGEGAFGCVFLAFDTKLKRNTAIKIPSADRTMGPKDAERFLEEAQTLAKLEHTNIVTVYDSGRTPEDSVYVVSRFVDGVTLEKRIKSARPDCRESARLLIPIAQALQYAHDRRWIHRDVKPANILIETASNTPFLADFGLAVREEDYSGNPTVAGTPAYMSPEQARGEGHRLDGRSDQFALGVILYQMLCGNRPFCGSTTNELFHQIISIEPEPPSAIEADVPAELERICLKALSKQISDRYLKINNMADDLAAWLTDETQARVAKAEEPVVPKGLRSFDAGDARFFIDLLPGVRNRDGLPDSIAFWKQRIEERDPEQTFSVGLIYGPSGCGKSSLVKAGLLPHLAPDVIAIYIEATPQETELRIANALRKKFPEWAVDENLSSLFSNIRRSTGNKVVIFIDQFEQWLYSHDLDSGNELVNALRQCDGGQLQAVVMVRDDFAMDASRFMRALDIRIVQGHNFATVDLFDIDHAKKVLTKFGQAYGRLPMKLANLGEAERVFLDAASQCLAQDGRVVSVRLSLFADMLKQKVWSRETLEDLGGIEGIGVTFLEEKFDGRDANPDHRHHAGAARGVLRALLPELGTDIKGHMRSTEELVEAAGYANRPREFGELLRILDGELRLVTPTAPEGDGTTSDRSPALGIEAPGSRDSRFYQLTHDYLVPSLRDWLTRKQKETRKGRAELKLAERASAWNAIRENKQLPTFWEWLNVRTLTDSKHWTPPQWEMMRRANRFNLSRLATAAMIVGLITAAGLWTWNRVDHNRRELLAEKETEQEATRIEGLVGELVSAEPAQVPKIVKELDANQQVASRYLSPLVSADANTVDEKRAQLHARLATVAHDKSLIEPLLEDLLTNKVAYIGPIRQQLRPYAGELTEPLRSILRDVEADPNRRFRAAVALADYVPESEAASWSEPDLQFVAGQLVSANAEFQPLLRENLRPISGRLLPDLEKIFGDSLATDAQRLSAANAFADYAAGNIAKLSQLLAVATPEQFAVLYPIVAAAAAPSTVEDMGQIAATLPPDNLGSAERVAYGQRRANVAVTLLRLGEREKVLPVFDMTDDPEALTQFIFRCRDRGVRVEVLLELLQIVTRGVSEGPSERPSPPALEPSSLAYASGYDWSHARYALLLALGEYTLAEIPTAQRDALLKQLGDWYRDDPSSGVHGAAGWLLRQWGQTEVARKIDQTAVPYSPKREWFTLAIEVAPSTNSRVGSLFGSKKKKTFYYTFIVFPAGEYSVLSFADKPAWNKVEVRQSVKLTRPFALLDREITFEELTAFSPMYAGIARTRNAMSEDAGFGATWYDSVNFCRWLSRQSGFSEPDQSYADPESLDKEAYPREPDPKAKWWPRDWPLELGRRGFRLPTESEWEVACRARSRTAYGFGSDAALLDRFSWFTANRRKHVHPPREKRPGVRGLFDLHGNVLEWTHDWYYVDYEKSEFVDPVGAIRGSQRVLRGGSSINDATSCRTAFRSPYDPVRHVTNGGLRVAQSLPTGQSPVAAESK